jgi:hypothetical protein
LEGFTRWVEKEEKSPAFGYGLPGLCCSASLFGPCRISPFEEVDIFLEEREGGYRKIVVKSGRVIGFILIGDISGAGFLLTLMKRKREISLPSGDLLSYSLSLQRYLPPNLGYRHSIFFNGPKRKFC